MLCRAVQSEEASDTDALLTAAEQGQVLGTKFHYFNTFVHAALILYDLELLDLISLRGVSLLLQCSVKQHAA